MSGPSTASRALVVLIVVLLGDAVPPPVAAAPGDDRGVESWQLEVMPYLWLPETHGTVSVRDRSADVDIGFDDVFDLLGDGDLFAAMGHFEVRKDKLAFFTDVVGVVIDDEGKGEIRRQTIDVDLDLDLDLVTLELGGAYRLLDRGRFQLEAIAGARYTYAYAEISADVAERQRNQDASEHFVDPFVGGRGGIRLLERWAFVFRGDVGGFGVGSQLSWVVLGGVLWSPSYTLGAARMTVFLGYKVHDLDYESGAGNRRVELDVQMRGPALGLGLTF